MPGQLRAGLHVVPQACEVEYTSLRVFPVAITDAKLYVAVVAIKYRFTDDGWRPVVKPVAFRAGCGPQ